MLTVISPAKKLDMTAVNGTQPTFPVFQDEAFTLVKASRRLSLKDLQKLMDISPALAKLNKIRFRDFAEIPVPQATKPAIHCFAGDTYQGLEAGSLDTQELDFAQNHLRILSGLYGVLRPFDAIQPYRLEMGSRLKTRRGRSLYEFWGSKVSQALNDTADQLGTDTLVNCASQEYFGAVDPAALNLRIIAPVFLEDKATGPKIVSFFAKKARGAMARFIIQNRLNDAKDLKDFTTGGYRFQPKLSDDNRLVFLRPERNSQEQPA